jgi:antitoxin component YwqK of YwqJK toxin-antitoxin module
MKRFLQLTLVLFLAVPAFAQSQPKNQYDAQGRKQGYWVKLNGDTLKYEGHFKDDLPEGEFKYYYSDKTIKSIVQYSEKGLMAKTVNYNWNGKKLAEGEYWDKKKHGLWQYYGADGKVILVEDYHYGVPEGEWKTFYPDGKPLSIKHYSNGKLNGPFTEFYPDSIVSNKGNYVNDMLDGSFQNFYLDGKVAVSGNYTKNLLSGTWMYFSERGFTDRRIIYSDGVLAKEEIPVKGADNKPLFIDINTIAYVYNDNGVSTIMMKDGSKHTSDRQFAEFDRILSEYTFYRINKNCFVTLYSVSNLKSYDPDQRVIILRPEAPGEVYVADEYAAGFLHWAGLIKGEIDPKDPNNLK